MKKIIAMACALSFALTEICYAEDVGHELDKITVSNEHTTNDIEDQSSTAMTLASLSLFASGVIAPLYLVWCSDKPSAWIYAGTSGIYVGSEAMNWSKYKDASNRAMVGYRNQERESQIASLQAASDQTKEAASAAQRKAKFAKVAAAGFAVASGVAVMEQMEFWDGNGACAKKGNIFSNFQLENHQTYDRHYQAIASAKDNQSAMTLFKEFMNVISGERKSPTLDEYRQFATYKTQPNIKDQLLFSVVGIENLMGTAYAGFGDVQMEKMGIGLGLAGAAAITIWNDQVMSMLPEWASKVASSGVTRSVVFGAHAAIALTAGNMTDKAANDIEGRAKQYDQIINQLKAPSNTQNVEGSVVVEGTTGNELTGSIVKPNETVDTEGLDNMGCLISKDGIVSEDANCDCKKTNSCRVANLPKIEFSSFDMPNAFNKTLGGMKNISSSLGQGHYGEAVANTGSVTGNAAQIGKVNNVLQKELNKRFAKEGRPTVDIDKMTKQATDAFNHGVGRALSSVSPEVAKQMLNLSTGSHDLSDVDKTLNKNKEVKEKLTKIKTTAPKNKVVENKKKDKKVADPFADMNFEVAGNTTTTNQAAINNVDQGYNYDGEAPNDISTRSDRTIFQQLSNRYIKTAYPRLFKEYN